VSRAALARFAVLCAFWGSSFLLLALALEGLSPAQVVLGRVTTGAVVIWAIVALRRQALPSGRGLWGHLAVAGLFGNVIPFTLFAFATERIPSGLAGLLNATTPLFTLAFAVAALSDERLSATRTAGFVLGFLGVATVIGPAGLGSGEAFSVTGQLAALAGAASYGVAFVYSRRFIAGRGVPPLSLAAGQLAVSSGILLLMAPVLATQPVDIDVTVAVAVLLLGGLSTGVAYILYYNLLVEVGATTTSMVTYLVPVVAVTLGVVVLGEPVTWNLFVGGAVVIVGVAVAEGRLGRRPPTLDAPVPSSEAPPRAAGPGRRPSRRRRPRGRRPPGGPDG
jgi:drug/metabolite transporter (DMT)-like permease